MHKNGSIFVNIHTHYKCVSDGRLKPIIWVCYISMEREHLQFLFKDDLSQIMLIIMLISVTSEVKSLEGCDDSRSEEVMLNKHEVRVPNVHEVETRLTQFVMRLTQFAIQLTQFATQIAIRLTQFATRLTHFGDASVKAEANKRPIFLQFSSFGHKPRRRQQVYSQYG